ncbi:MAG: HDOD domain-containing protein [Pseudomonadota bacterium]
MSMTLEEVISHAEAAIRLPKSAMQIHDIAQNPETELSELVAAVETDPAFSARLLRLANSSLYSRGVEVSSLDQAIGRVGNNEVSQLALVLSAAEEFSGLETDLMKMTSFWKHSLTTAILARNIMRSLKLRADGVFSAGLLHDMGLLVLFHVQTAQMRDVLQQALEQDEDRVIDMEREMFGFDHTVVGKTIADDWQLPGAIGATIRYHHAPEDADSHCEVVASVALANAIESADQPDDDHEGSVAIATPFRESIQRIINIEPIADREAQMLRSAQSEAEELQTYF